MTELSRPWPDVEYSSEQWQEVLAALAHGSTGVIPDFEEELACVATSPVSKDVEIGIGRCIIKGVLYDNDATFTQTMSDNTSGQDRIDLIVLRADYTEETVTIKVLEGTPAGSPVAQSPTQTLGVLWEFPVAEVYCANGFASLADSDITDRRFFMLAKAAGATLVNGDGAALSIGAPVKVDTATDFAVDTTTTEGDPRILDALMAGGADGENVLLPMNVRCTLYSDSAVTRGNLLTASSTAGQVTPGYPGAFAIALETTGGAGNVEALLLNRPIPNYVSIYHDNSVDYTTPSSTLANVDATNLQFTMVCRGGPVRVWFFGMHTNPTGSYDPTCFDVDIDGGTISGKAEGLIQDSTAGVNKTAASFGVTVEVTPGSHTFTLQWRRTAAGTAILHSNGELVGFGAYEL